MPESSCPGDSSNCQSHFHDEDPRYLPDASSANSQDDLEAGRSVTLGSITPAGPVANKEAEEAGHAQDCNEDVDFRRIIRNFTPSYVQASVIPCK